MEAISTAKAEVLTLMEDQIADAVVSMPVTAPAVQPRVVAEVEGSLADSIRASATRCVQRHILQNGAKRVVFRSNFRTGGAICKALLRGWLIDPVFGIALSNVGTLFGVCHGAALDAAKLEGAPRHYSRDK